MTAGRSVNNLSKDWCTPQKYVEPILKFFDYNIYLDPCSNTYSTVGAKTEFYLPEIDGLKESWNYPTIYVNPPYGADRKRKTTIKNWICKCCQANKEYKSEVLALIPVATNTRHWKDYIFGKANAVCFLYDTRLKFFVNGEESKKGAPMACAMIYWGNNYERFYEIFKDFGYVVRI